MSYFLSKILWFFAAPDNVILALWGVGAVLLWTRWRSLGKGVITGAAGVSLVVFFVPLGDYLMRPLEDRFPTLRELPERVDGVVVLGGSHKAGIAQARRQPQLNASAERSTTLLMLARRFPEARLIISAGRGGLDPDEVRESVSARMFYAEMGLDPVRVTVVDGARNTIEAASQMKDVTELTHGGAWLLVTSAYHMPRSMGVFRGLGWDVTPYPVDYSTGPPPNWLSFEFAERLWLLRRAVREWFGLSAYYLMGRTDAWFPAPADPPERS